LDNNAPSLNKKDEINGNSTILDGILSSPKKEAAEKSAGLLASMLQEKKSEQQILGKTPMRFCFILMYKECIVDFGFSKWRF